jgi:CheY-like chemotaxis protein
LFVLDMTGVPDAIDLIVKIRASPELRQTPLLAIADWGTGLPTLALSNGADAFEPKPVAATRLIAAIGRLLDSNRAMTAKAASDL